MLRLGFVGCGGIARYHVDVIGQNVKGIRVTAGADVSGDALKAFREKAPDAALYRDYRTMLSQGELDAVCVALPTRLHRQATVAAARHGKHVFCEKPMAMSLGDCDAMIEAADRAGVTLMIGHVRRYDSDWGAWRKLVRSGVIGRPVVWRQMAGGGAPGAWFMDARMGGGPFMDGCVHNWDFANWVFGRPVEAAGSLLRLAPTSALDTGTAIVRYERGDEVSLSWSWGLPRGVRASGGCDLLGPKGAIRFPGGFPESEFPEGFDRAKFGAYLVEKEGSKRLEPFPKANMFAREWEDFRDAVRNGRRPVATAANSRLAVAVALAVLEAGRKRKAVRISG